MARIRIATFNVENPFARYRFKSKQDPETAVREGGQPRQPQVAVWLIGLDETRGRMLVVDVEPNELVHREPPVQVGHGAFKRPESYPLPGGSGFIVSVGYSEPQKLWEKVRSPKHGQEEKAQKHQQEEAQEHQEEDAQEH